MVSLFTTSTSTRSRHMIVAVRLASSEMSAISYKAKTVLRSTGTLNMLEAHSSLDGSLNHYGVSSILLGYFSIVSIASVKIKILVTGLSPFLTAGVRRIC